MGLNINERHKRLKKHLLHIADLSQKQSLTKKIIECNKDTEVIQHSQQYCQQQEREPYARRKNSDQLTEDFATFFLDKKLKCVNFSQIVVVNPYLLGQNQVTNFTSFALMTNKEVLEMMSAMENKSYEQDTMPAALLKKMLPRCIDTIMQLVNISLTKGEF